MIQQYCALHREALRHALVHLTAVSALLGLIGWSCWDSLDRRDLIRTYDAYHHLQYAYHLAHFGAFTRGVSREGVPKKDAYREPLFAAYMSLGINCDATLRELSIAQLSKGPNILKIRRQQIPVLLATALLAFFVAGRMLRKKWAAYCALLMVGFSESLVDSVSRLNTEHHAAFWTLLLAYLVYRGAEKLRWPHLGAIGATAGILVLIKASFMFFIWPVLLFFLILGRCRRTALRRLAPGLGLMLVCYAIPVGGWMLRNHGQYGVFFITHRAGVVLAIRAAYNQMTGDEYAASFLYWTPDPRARLLLDQRYGRNALKEGGRLGMLNRGNKHSYYQIGRQERDKVVEELKTGHTPFSDALVKKAAMKKISGALGLHLRAMLPLGWRGLFVEDGYRMKAPLTFEVSGGALISLVLFLSFAVFVGVILANRRWDWFGFASPGIYLFALNLGASHCLPRYNQPLIPVLIVSLLLVAAWLGPRLGRLSSLIRRSSKADAAPDEAG